jgi:copper(I)-binding protein
VFVKKAPALGPTVVLLLGMLIACGAPSGPQIRAQDVWARPALATGETQMGQPSEGNMGMEKGMGGTGAVFMLLKNEGGEADRLIGGQTDVANVVEIHETIIEGDVMKMQMLSDGLEVPARGNVLLKPGSYHIMLIGMKRDLEPGDTFTLNLQFKMSGTLMVEPEIREP